jgi:hypothetical protein
VSTFLVSFGVVAATIAAVVSLALGGPDQPATIWRQSDRVKEPKPRRSARREAAPVRAASPAPPPMVPSIVPSGPALALPDSDIMRLRVLPAGRTTLWVRIRSGLALMILVAVLGALLALAVGGIGFALVLLIRSATS